MVLQTEHIQKLDQCLRRKEQFGTFCSQQAFVGEPKIAFVFSGQGSQWAGMGRDLLLRDRVFRQSIEACEALVRAEAGWSVVEELMASKGETHLDRAEIAQICIFAVQFGLINLLRSWGLTPEAVVGHSMGEVAAAYTGGVLTLEEAMRLLINRGRLIQRVPYKGKMIHVSLKETDLEPLIRDYAHHIEVAAVNGEFSTVLSARADLIDDIALKLQQSGVAIQVLPVNYAFHSSQMEEIQHELRIAMETLKPSPSCLAFYSTVTGAIVNGSYLDAKYWARNLRERVRFHAAIEAMIADGFNIFIEIGPHPVLAGHVIQAFADAEISGLVVPSLRRGRKSWNCMLELIRSLYLAGCIIDWNGLFPVTRPHVALPTYPWHRKRFWIDRGEPESYANREESSGMNKRTQLMTNAFLNQGRLLAQLTMCSKDQQVKLVTQFIRERVSEMLQLDDPATLDVNQPTGMWDLSQ